LAQAREASLFPLPLAQAGMRTALIERDHIGGTSVNMGCTPTKTMLASGRVAYFARRAADYGVRTGPISIDLQKVRQRKRDIVESFRSRSQSSLESTANPDLIFGDARFSGPRSIDVFRKDGSHQSLSAANVFINAAPALRVPGWMASRTFRLWTTPPSWNSTAFLNIC
jgi:pyruvate/2-oxoglutarate dehydrogenase complex dihydrolipoamide dehydrogenase (E3) component